MIFYRRKLVAILFASACAFGALSGSAPACDDGMIRDAAFDMPRDVYRLCVFGNASDSVSKDIFERLQAWRTADAPHHNLEVVFVDAGAQDVDWIEFGIPSAPPELPAVALVGRIPSERKSFIVDHWLPGPTDEELQVLRSSPLRERIRNDVATHLAVFVHAPGESPDTNVRDAIERVRAERAAQGLSPVSIVTVDRADPAERLVLSFANIPTSGDDWVCVVFGRGKFMTPLIGKEISETALEDMLGAIEADCTCSQSPSRLGVDIPMAWDDNDDASFVRLATPPAILASEAGHEVDTNGESIAGGSRDAFGSTLFLSIGVLAILAIASAIGITLRRER